MLIQLGMHACMRVWWGYRTSCFSACWQHSKALGGGTYMHGAVLTEMGDMWHKMARLQCVCSSVHGRAAVCVCSVHGMNDNRHACPWVKHAYAALAACMW